MVLLFSTLSLFSEINLIASVTVDDILATSLLPPNNFSTAPTYISIDFLSPLTLPVKLFTKSTYLVTSSDILFLPITLRKALVILLMSGFSFKANAVETVLFKSNPNAS